MNIEEFIKEISEKRATIIDNFCKAFIASRWDDYFSKQKKIDFRRIELVVCNENPSRTVYFCRLRRGKLPRRKKCQK